MSLHAKTFADRFCFSRKSGIGGSGWVHLKGAGSTAISGLSLRNALVAIGSGGPLLSSYSRTG